MSSKENVKVERITKGKVFEEIIGDLLEGLRDNSVKSLILCFLRDRKDKDSAFVSENTSNVVRQYWFGGDSSINVLGLLEYMKQVVNDYIKYGEEE